MGGFASVYFLIFSSFFVNNLLQGIIQHLKVYGLILVQHIVKLDVF